MCKIYEFVCYNNKILFLCSATLSRETWKKLNSHACKYGLKIKIEVHVNISNYHAKKIIVTRDHES